MSKFFTYSQNNSGGHFDHDEKAGIGHYVIVEAKDANHANQRAEEIGLYFDGVDKGQDCECCGDRWYQPWSEGSEKPMIYDTDVSNLKYEASYSWGIPSYIHYADGTFKKIDETQAARK